MMDIQSFATDDFVLEHLTDSKGHRQLLDSFSVASGRELLVSHGGEAGKRA